MSSPETGYSIARCGVFGRKRRLVSAIKLTPADFDAIAAALKQPPRKARKIGLVAARRAQSRRDVETRWNGEETRNVAEVGDWIVTNLSPRGAVLRDRAGNQNTYVIRGEQFDRLYDPTEGENEFGPFFKSKSIVEFLFFGGGFDIQAPWGERQTGKSGYVLRNGTEVYGNEQGTFAATYEVLG